MPDSTVHRVAATLLEILYRVQLWVLPLLVALILMLGSIIASFCGFPDSSCEFPSPIFPITLFLAIEIPAIWAIASRPSNPQQSWWQHVTAILLAFVLLPLISGYYNTYTADPGENLINKAILADGPSFDIVLSLWLIPIGALFLLTPLLIHGRFFPTKH